LEQRKIQKKIEEGRLSPIPFDNSSEESEKTLTVVAPKFRISKDSGIQISVPNIPPELQDTLRRGKKYIITDISDEGDRKVIILMDIDLEFEK